MAATARGRNAGGQFTNAGNRDAITWGGTLPVNLKLFPARMDSSIKAAFEYHRGHLESSMKRNASWTDRTSNARNGLRATVEGKGNALGGTYTLAASHSVPYGIFLELRWSGRYAIIMPSLEAEEPKLMKTLSMLFAQIGKGLV